MPKRRTRDEKYPNTVGKFKNLVPEGTQHYLRAGLVFTQYSQDLVLDLISMGEHLYTACQIAGVQVGTLHSWLRKGRESTDESDPYYKFFTKYCDRRLKGLKLLREKQRLKRADPQGYGDEPVTTTHNPLPLSLFTLQAQESILTYLEKGTFPGIAAEASGVPAAIFMYWLDQGRAEMHQQRDDGPFLSFYLECTKIAAQARAKAEVSVYEEQPLAWLLHGPGRDAPEVPGWTKQSQVTGPNAGPVKVVTEWKVATLPPPPVTPRAIESSLDYVDDVENSPDET
jgi:hypothetical protein